MANLYELNKAIALYQMEFDPDTGEWLNEDELNDLQMARDEKIENICLLIKHKRADIEAFKAEEKSLSERRKSLEKEVARLEKYVGMCLSGEDFETTRVKVSWRTSETVEIDDDELVPKEYKNFTVIGKPVKAEIKKLLKRAEATGEEVSWARLEKHNNMKIV